MVSLRRNRPRASAGGRSEVLRTLKQGAAVDLHDLTGDDSGPVRGQIAGGCRLEVGVYKRTFGHGNSKEPGVHWSKAVRFDRIAEGLGCRGVYVEKPEELSAAIREGFASGKPTVIHVPIDPVVNHGGNDNKGMPSYDEFPHLVCGRNAIGAERAPRGEWRMVHANRH